MSKNGKNKVEKAKDVAKVVGQVFTIGAAIVAAITTINKPKD